MDSRNLILQINTELRALHSEFLAKLKSLREEELGQKLNAVEWFQALMGAPELTWVRPFNTLVSDVDALSEQKMTDEKDLAVVKNELQKLLNEGPEKPSFYHVTQNKTELMAPIMIKVNQLKQLLNHLDISPTEDPHRLTRDSWHKKDRTSYN